MGLAYGASAVVISGEAWAKNAHWGVQRFVSDERHECVALIGETPFERVNKMLPIIRFQGGNFAGFDKEDVYRDAEISVRPTELVMGFVADEWDREQLKREFRRDGHRIGRGREYGQAMMP